MPASPAEPPSGPHASAPAGPDDARVPSRVWSGTLWQVAGRIFGSLCTLVGLGLLSRHLAMAEFGRFTFYVGIFAVLDAWADFGTGALTIQRTAGDPSALPSVLAAARRLRLRLGLVGFALVLSGALLFEEAGWPYLALAALYPATHALELSATIYKNAIRWRVPVALRVVASILRLSALGAGVLAGWSSAAPFVLATAAASALTNLALHLVARRHLPRERAAPVTAGLLREAWPLGLSGLCAQLYFYVDNLFVRALAGEDELGIYNGAMRVMSFAILTAQHASAAALPWFTRRGLAGGEAARRVAAPLFVAACLGAGLAWPWADELLGLVYGAEYAAGAGSLRLLALAACAIHLGAPFLAAVVASGRTRRVLVITAGGLLLNLLGNALLVGPLGAEGAAAATLATEGVVALGAAWTLFGQGPEAQRGVGRHLPWYLPAGAAVFGLGVWGSSLLAG